jgi:transcriptional regulator with XRE-family HTH domain
MGLRLNIPVVRKFLEEENMSEYRLSQEMDLDKGFVNRVLRGERGVGPKFITGILRVTGKPFDELFILGTDMSVDKKEGVIFQNKTKAG